MKLITGDRIEAIIENLVFSFLYILSFEANQTNERNAIETTTLNNSYIS